MKNSILLYITISVFSFNIYSQKARVTAADKKYDSYAYVDAIKTYERVAEKGYKSIDMFKKLGNDSRGKLFKENPNYLDAIKANSGRYQVEDAGINSKYSDYGTAIYSNKIIFASARDTGSLGQRKHKWTNQ